MAIESALRINNWKINISDVEKSEPNLCHCFTTMWNTELVQHDDPVKWMKYLDYKTELDADELESKFIGNHTITLKNKTAEKSDLLKHWIKGNFFNSCTAETEIITYANVLSAVMTTPFNVEENKRTLELCATVDSHNKIYLVQSPKRVPFTIINPLRSVPDYNHLLEKHYEKLKEYLFVRWPIDHYRNVTSTLDRNFYEMYRINLGEHKILYAAELLGINSYEKISSLNELKTAAHIVCDVFYTDELSPAMLNYNPSWWSKAYLTNAKQCLIGVCEKTNDRIDGIMKFDTDKFSDTPNYENLWSPKSSWKFLDTFLTFVKDEIDRTTFNRNHFVWKFKIIDNGHPYVICKPRFVENKSETSAKIEHFM